MDTSRFLKAFAARQQFPHRARNVQRPGENPDSVFRHGLLQGVSHAGHGLNRRAFPWGAEDEELLRWYRKLGQLRGGRPSLQRGDICYLYADGSGLALRRQWDGEVTTAAMNSGKEPLTMTLSWPHPIATDAMTGQQFLADHGTVRLILPPVSGVLLV